MMHSAKSVEMETQMDVTDIAALKAEIVRLQGEMDHLTNQYLSANREYYRYVRLYYETRAKYDVVSKKLCELYEIDAT